MNAVLDIIIVGIIIFCVAMGYKNGFIKTVMNFLSFIIAFFLAKTFSPPLSDYMCKNWIAPNFADKAAVQLDKIALPGGGFEPEGLSKTLKGWNIQTPDFNEWIAAANNEASKAADNIVKFVAERISSFLAFIIIFVIALILLKIAVIFINKAAKLPGLKLINKTGGILLGILYGIIGSYVFVLLAYYVLPYLSANTVISSAPEVMDGTVFFKWFFEHSPVNYIMGLADNIDYIKGLINF